MKKIGLIVGITMLFALVSSQMGQAENQILERRLTKVGQKYVPGEIIVKFKPGVRENVIANLNSRHGASEFYSSRFAGFKRLRILKRKTVSEMMEIYKRNPNVEYAEPNYIAYAFLTPNDEYYNYQWHMDNPEYGGIQMEKAWDLSTGAGVTVAIIDTGIAYEDYCEGSGWRQKCYEQAVDLAETYFVPGYDFVNNDEHPNDDSSPGHGTHVAGTVAQSTDNIIGVAGVAFNAYLMPIKVLDKNGSGTYSDVADGIYWAVDHGAQVINLSLGGSQSSTTLEQAVAYAYNNGVTVVAAAGNDGKDTLSYPAAYDDYVIGVGATRYDETLAYYSNFGPSLDLVAPGGDLNVDQNGDGYADGVLQQSYEKRGWFGGIEWNYYFMSGTSMAAPHVSGVAALLIANGNAITPSEVRNALQGTAEDKGDPGKDNIYGYGLIDAHAALQWTAGPVDNPPTVNITSPQDRATVSGQLTIEATASDDIGVVQVDFYINATHLETDNTSPYSISWDSTSVADGTHYIEVVAIDTLDQSSLDTIGITVDNINDPPVANAGPDQTATVDQVVNFDGSGSFDPDGNIVSYDWDFGDETTASGGTASHAYAQAAIYTVTLVVTDNGGATGEDTAKVTVSEAPTLPTMHVGDITLSADTRTWRRTTYCKVTATVPLLDASSGPVKEAMVYAEWSEAYNRDVSGSTSSEGEVTFKTRWVRLNSNRTFTLTVDNVTKDSWVYDPAANLETSDSITIP